MDISDFSSKFFLYLNENIKYCVLRNHETLPESTSNDIDLFVSSSSFKSICHYLDNFNFAGWRCFSCFKVGLFRRYFIINIDTLEILPIDIMTNIQHKGLVLVSEKQISNNIIYSNGIAIANREIQDLILLTKISILKMQSKPLDKYIEKLNDNDYFKDFLMSENSKLFFLSLVNKSEVNVFSQLSSVLSYGYNRLLSLCRRQSSMKLSGGLFISLIGPDGSGKSTAASIIESKLGPFFSSVDYYHAKPGKILSMNQLKNRLLRREKSEEKVNNGDVERSKVSNFRYMINVIYYTVDFILFWSNVLKSRKENKLIIFDRYYHDFFLHPEFELSPKLLTRILRLLIPDADLNIIMSCDSNVIHERKKELTKSEIDIFYRQVCNYKKITKNCSVISNDNTLYELENDLICSFVRANLAK